MKTLYVDTHKDFLNTVFGTSFQMYYRSVWPYKKLDDAIVWMIRLYDVHDGEWKNRISDDGETIREDYLGNEACAMWNGKPITLANLYGRLRAVISIEERNGFRSYTFKGVYRLDEANSRDLHRIYLRIPDDKAEYLYPELYRNLD